MPPIKLHYGLTEYINSGTYQPSGFKQVTYSLITGGFSSVMGIIITILQGLLELFDEICKWIETV